MKLRLFNLISKMATCLAALAVLCATSNVSGTCIFMTYQPDVPGDLED